MENYYYPQIKFLSNKQHTKRTRTSKAFTILPSVNSLQQMSL